MVDPVNNYQEQIEELEKLATEVLSLKKQMRQRRPIVIEFCGSPKAGKTSCINSLNIFLKRNGFKTAILNEQASFSPISDKHNPVFNVWTCSSAINEINEKWIKHNMVKKLMSLYPIEEYLMRCVGSSG